MGAGKMEGGKRTSTCRIMPSGSSATGTKTASSNGAKGALFAALVTFSALMLRRLIAPSPVARSKDLQSCEADTCKSGARAGSCLPSKSSRANPNLLTKASLSIWMVCGASNETRHCEILLCFIVVRTDCRATAWHCRIFAMQPTNIPPDIKGSQFTVTFNSFPFLSYKIKWNFVDLRDAVFMMERWNKCRSESGPANLSTGSPTISCSSYPNILSLSAAKTLQGVSTQQTRAAEDESGNVLFMSECVLTRPGPNI